MVGPNNNNRRGTADGARPVPVNVRLHEPELDTLPRIPCRLAWALYIELRRRMDGATRIVGKRRGVSWMALARALDPDSAPGPVDRRPTLQELRTAAAWLARPRYRLVEMRGDSNARELVFYLPQAPALSLAQNQPNRNPTDQPNRPATEGRSTGTQPGTKAATQQASKSLDKHRAAADHGASLTAATPDRAALRAEVNEYRVPPRTELQAPRGTTEGHWRHFEVIAAQRRLSREVLQSAFDAIAGVMAAGKTVKSPVGLFSSIVAQITAGQFYDEKAGAHAKRERGGGRTLTDDELDHARMLGEGGPAPA